MARRAGPREAHTGATFRSLPADTQLAEWGKEKHSA